MTDESKNRSKSPLEALDPETLEARLKDSARLLSGSSRVDNLELKHLIRVLTGCSLILTDVYSDERIAKIMQSDRLLLSSLVGQLIEEQRRAGGEVFYRIRRLPDDVRVI